MGLDFTHIADKQGAALYVLYGGSHQDQQTFTRLKEDIEKQTNHQVVLLDVTTPDGENVRDFYDIMPEQLPAVFIVKDDDSIAQMWSGTGIPTNPSDIAFHLRQISEA